MDKVLKIILIVLASVVLVGGLFVGGAFVGSQFFGRASTNGNLPAMMNGSAQQPGNNFGPGMMGGGQGQRGPAGNPGQGMMNGGQGYDGNSQGQANLTPVTADQAKTAAQTFVTALKIDGLQVGDVTIVGESAYVTVTETAGGNGAFQLVVDPVSKTAHPEQGAATLWNLKYGGVLQTAQPFGFGPMSGRGNAAAATATPAASNAAAAVTPADVSADMPVSADQAVKDAQAYLDQAVPGATAAATPVKFYGYYSLTFSKDGSVAGLLSVNGFNGEVLPGIQHGMFGMRPN